MAKQLSLFSEDAPPDVPEPVNQLLVQGAALAISISGGKDSQAMLNWLVHLRHKYQWSGHFFAIHAHLGRAEWSDTLSHCHSICDQKEIELVVVLREQGDLVDRWRERMEKLMASGNTKPFWSSAASRYCTSDLKRGPINKYLRQFATVISAEGIRGQESPNRAKQPVVSVREEISAARLKRLLPEDAIDKCLQKGRLALTWHPLQHWDIEQVWEWCGTTTEEYQQRVRLYNSGHRDEALAGWPAHSAYIRGNERLSCALCVLASRNDLINGARHNPELYRQLVEMEKLSGWKFRQDLSLAQLQPYI